MGQTELIRRIRQFRGTERLCATEVPQLFRIEAVCSWNSTAVQERGCVQLKPHSCSGEVVCSWSPTALQERGCLQLKPHRSSWEELCAAEVPQLFVKLIVFRRNLNVYYKHQPSRALHPTASQFSPLYTVTFCFFRTVIRNVAVSKCDRDTTWSVLFFLSWRPELPPFSAGTRPDFWRRPVVLLRSPFAIGWHRLAMP